MSLLEWPPPPADSATATVTAAAGPQFQPRHDGARSPGSASASLSLSLPISSRGLPSLDDVTVITYQEDPAEVRREIADLMKEEEATRAGEGAGASPPPSVPPLVTLGNGNGPPHSMPISPVDHTVCQTAAGALVALGEDPPHVGCGSSAPAGHPDVVVFDTNLTVSTLTRQQPTPPVRRGRCTSAPSSTHAAPPRPRRSRSDADKARRGAAASPGKQCRYAEGAPALPASLAGLYLAALVAQAGAPRLTPLLYTLQLCSEIGIAERRLAAARRGRALEQARCDALYRAAAECRAREEAKRARAAKEREDALREECSFTPRVSATAARLPGKGLDTFMERCVDWQRERAQKLAARYAREEECTAPPPEPPMRTKSRLLAERRERAGVGAARPALWEPKRLAGDAGGGGEGRGRSPVTARSPSSNLPVTTVEERRQRERLRRLLAEDRTDAGKHPSAAAAASSPSCSTPSASRGGSHSTEAYVARVEADLLRRHANVERMRKEREMEDGGTAYASITGQPLFHPNAMPTALKDGRRVPYTELSKKEQREFRKLLREHGQEHVLASCLRHHEAAGPDKSGLPNKRPSFAADVAAALETVAEQRERTMERLRAQAAAEAPFHPRITPRSAQLALGKTGGVPVHQRHPPAGSDTATVRKRLSAGTEERQQRGEPRGRPTADDPPASPSARAAAEQALVQDLLARNALWEERRRAHLTQLAESREEQERAACTFTPRRALIHQLESTVSSPPPGERSASVAVSGGSGDPVSAAEDRRRTSLTVGVHTMDELQRMVEAADVRLANELELLRAQAANIDPDFLIRVLEDGDEGKGSRDRSARRSLSTLGAGTPVDRAFRRPTHAAAAPRSPQYRIAQLSLQNAPRLPQRPGHVPRDTGAASQRPHSRGLDVSAYALLAEGASPIAVARSSPPSVSRSPDQGGWRALLSSGGSPRAVLHSRPVRFVEERSGQVVGGHGAAHPALPDSSDEGGAGWVGGGAWRYSVPHLLRCAMAPLCPRCLARTGGGGGWGEGSHAQCGVRRSVLPQHPCSAPV